MADERIFFSESEIDEINQSIDKLQGHYRARDVFRHLRNSHGPVCVLPGDTPSKCSGFIYTAL
jgi:hypothetical protein